jgi:hypothetical protein
MIRHNEITIDSKRCAIRHRGAEVFFKSPEFRSRYEPYVQYRLLCHLILGGAQSVGELFELIYGDRADGGPEQGPHIIFVHFYHMRERLRLLSLSLRKSKDCGVLRYWVEPASAAGEPV